MMYYTLKESVKVSVKHYNKKHINKLITVRGDDLVFTYSYN